MSAVVIILSRFGVVSEAPYVFRMLILLVFYLSERFSMVIASGFKHTSSHVAIVRLTFQDNYFHTVNNVLCFAYSTYCSYFYLFNYIVQLIFRL